MAEREPRYKVGPSAEEPAADGRAPGRAPRRAAARRRAEEAGRPEAGWPDVSRPAMGRPEVGWGAAEAGMRVRALRAYLCETQVAFADRLGTNQQTVSEWERGARRPRRMAQRLLHLVAEQAAFYRTDADTEGDADAEADAAGGREAD